MAPPEKRLRTLLPRELSSSHVQDPGQDRPPSPAATTSVPRPSSQVNYACDSCRKRKIKCDGARPRCGPCVKRSKLCNFTLPKGSQLRQAQREQIAKYQSVIELLREGNDAESSVVLQQLRESSDVEEAVDFIAQTRLLLPVSSSTVISPRETNFTGPPPTPYYYTQEQRRLTSPFEDSDFMFERLFMVDPRDNYVNEDIFVNVSARSLPLSRWTTVPANDQLMNHLLNMFFTWDTVVERAVYRPIFEEDVVYKNPKSANQEPGTFCTPFLVNALLAVSCLYTLNPITFKDPMDSMSRGRLWADEAERLLAEIDKPSIPLLQGLHSLFVYEGDLGIGSKALEYFQRGVIVYAALNNELDILPHHEMDGGARRQQEKQAISWCMWGYYCCEWRSSQALGIRKQSSKPNIARAWHEPDFPLRQEDCVGYWWFPYPISLRMQASMQVEIRQVDTVLSEIVEDTLNFIYPEMDKPLPQTNSFRGLELYDEFVNWKLSLPSRIRIEEAVLPSAILLNIAVDLMLTAVLRPFCHMTKSEFGRFDPRERYLAHACNLMSSIWTFRAFYQIRFEYWFVHVVGTVAYAMLPEVEGGLPTCVDNLIRACQCLHEMKISLPLATDVLSGIHAAFKRYKLRVPPYMTKYFETVRHREDGGMHHAITALLPSPTDGGSLAPGVELQLRQLLTELDDSAVD
ncbi:fungal-specific transcription factor [Xylariales sp. PMI_506]|nr:fungal-specific transcription factor [Xylariales sp. PMI_506]